MKVIPTCRRLLLLCCCLAATSAINAQVLFTWMEPDNFCAPTQILFNDLTSPQPASWQWTVTGIDSMFSSIENPAFAFTIPGDYTVCLSVDGNPAPVYCQDFTIFAPPQAAFQIAPGFSPTGPAPHTVCFEDLSVTGSAPIVYYEWDLGLPPSANVPNPCITYPSATQAHVSLVISDCNGCWDAVSSPDNFIEVLPDTGVYAGFEIVVDTGRECSFPLEFTCFDRSLGDVASWTYNMTGPDIASSVMQDAHFVITIPGSYTITQTLNNGADSYSEEFTISLPLVGPDIDFTTSNYTSCFAPFPAQLTSASADAYRYFWEVSPNTVTGSADWQEDPNPEIRFDSPDNYSVTLTASDVAGCTTVVEKPDFILVSDSITASIVSDDNDNLVCGESEVCFNVYVNILLDSTEVAGIQWNLPGATPNNANGSAICADYTGPGTYDVSATIYFTGECDSLVVTDVLLVGDMPQLNAEVNPTALCLNECVQGTASSDLPNTQFDWYFEAPGGYVDGGIGTSSAVSYCYSDEWQQPFTVLMVGSNCFCSDTVELVTIVNPPGAQFQWETGCYPTTEVVFQVNEALGVFADSGAWYVDGQTSSPVHTFDDIDNAGFTYDFGIQGSFDVQLVLHSSFTGCTDSVTHTVEVPYPFINDFVANPRGANCPPLAINASPVPPGFMDTILWYPGNGDGPIATAPPHAFSYTYTDYAEDGWFDMSMTYQNGACRDSLFKWRYIQLSPASGSFGFTPDAGPAPLQVEFTLDDVLYSDSVMWHFNENDSLLTTADTTALTVEYTETGTYQPYVQLLAAGCPPVTLEDGTLNVFMVSGIAGRQEELMSVHPNPVDVNTMLYWELPSGMKVIRAVVFAASGQLVLSSGNITNSSIRLEGLPAGNYVLLLETDAGSAARLFQVVHPD